MSKIRLHGSSSGYTEIAPVAASGNNTLTLPDDGTILSKDAAGAVGVTSIKSSNVNVGAAVTITESGIEASGIGITCASINGTQIGGRRNLIINGAMNVAQRGTSSSSSGNTQQTVDRFYVDVGGADEQPTQAQVDVASGTTPYTLGFRKSYKITNGNQTSGAGGTDYIAYIMKLEAQDIANSGWNYTDPNSFITLSFWIKSSVAQAFSGSLRSVDGSVYHYKYDTPSLSADTWTKVVKTIPGNANLTFNNDNGHGFTFSLQAFIGTTYTSSNSDTETWVAYSSTKFANNMTSTWYTTNDSTIELTGVQLEVGPQATAFEHRSAAEELSLCRRYCYVITGDGTQGGNGSGEVAISENATLYQATNLFCSVPFKVSMRAKPSLSVTTGTNYYIAYSNNGGTNLDGSQISMNGNTGTENIVLTNNGSSIGTSGHSAIFRTNNTSSKLTISAEL